MSTCLSEMQKFVMEKKAAERFVIALGFFDGVHLGHAELIKMAKRRALEKNATPAVLSFDVSPMSVVKGEPIPLIGSIQTRKDVIIRNFGINEVIIQHFDKALMTMPWEDFILHLIERYSTIHFVVGHDFNCGYRGQGTARKIADFCGQRGIGCDIIPEVKLDAITVSSSHIRTLIAQGDIKSANTFLGHPYTISGVVRQGKKLGRTLGAPTINLELEMELLLPQKGVYATIVRTDGTELPAVTNVGTRPSFDDGEALTVEAFLLNYSGDLYGRALYIDFYDFLRPERVFADANELASQIKQDAENARNALAALN